MSDTQTLDRAKDQLADKKRKLEMREKLLKEKERKIKARALSAVGRLANRAGILEMDQEELLGAFLEIAERSSDSKTREQWKDRVAQFQQKSETTPLIVIPEAEPTKNLREVMKTLGFRWNAFRKEWYGHGNLESVQEATKASKVKVEAVE